MVNKFAAEFRRALYMEHLGIDYKDAEDPLSPYS